MDLTTSTTAATTTTVKTPEAETETPTRIQPIKPSPLTNGVLKRHLPLHHHHHHHTNINNHHAVVVTYKECLKNHAASLGGHAVDGCGEFMPSPNATSTDPTSLKCAACGCHRNFHRREPEEPLTPLSSTPALEYQPHHRHHPPPPPPTHRGSSSSPNSPSPPPISSAYYPSAPHMLLALSTGLSGPPQETSQPISSNPPPSTIFPGSGGIISTLSNSNPNGRKRFRTKFTQDQKEKMLEFAERVGWKMQKRDEDSISEFCRQINVDKNVFKVWMHNNKNTFAKKDLTSTNTATDIPTTDAAAATNTRNDYGNSNSTNVDSATIHYHHHNIDDSNDDNKGDNGRDMEHNHHHHNHFRNTTAADQRDVSGHDHHGGATNGSSSTS